MQTFLSNSLPLLARLAASHNITLNLPASVPGSRLPTDIYDRACAQLAAQVSAPAPGLRAAQLWHPSDFSTVGYAWFASPNLRSALRKLVRYRRLVGDRASLEIDETQPEGLWLHYAHRRNDAVLDQLGSEIILSVILSLCQRNYGEALAPRRVLFDFAAPPQAAPYEAFFGCPVEFNAGRTALLLANDAVDRSLPTANLEIASSLDELLTRQLAALDRNDFVARCRAALFESLAGKTPEAADIARRLYVSERTLQRRLAQRQTSFHELVDETRQELATAYLRDETNSVTDVAFRVGFSTPSAFSRAFTRWTGRSPSDWRNALQHG